MLTRGNGVALWLQIYSKLEEAISTGSYAFGERLPSENVLSRRFGVNRHTVRRAIAALAENGIIRVEQGRGSFVREAIIHYPVSKRTRFSETLSRQRRTPGNVLLSALEAEAPVMIAKALKIHPGELVTCISSAGEADGHRISYSHSYFPEKLFPGMSAVYRRLGSVTQALEHFGAGDYVRETTSITARIPTTEEARQLGQHKSRPVLVTESINTNHAGTPVEFGICLFASDWVQILVESFE